MRESGFSLMEAIVATVISVIAVVGLAYAFGLGRSFIDDFQVRRVASGAGQACMDSLITLPVGSPALTPGTHPAIPMTFTCWGRPMGTITWRVTAPSDAPASVATLLREVTATVAWTNGSLSDSLSFTRLVSTP